MSSKYLKFLSLIFIVLISFGCDKENTNNNNPGDFKLVFVNDNATDIILTPILTWESSTDSDGDSITYDILIDKIADLDNINDDPTTIHQSKIKVNSVILTTPLIAGTAYRWRVVAIDGRGGLTNSSNVFNFTTSQLGSTTNLPPNPFVLLTPANGATNVSLMPRLTWQVATDPDNDPVVYDVFFGQGQSANTGIGNGIRLPRAFTNQLSPNTTYSWDVVAKDFVGNVRPTPTFSFTTGDGGSGGGTLLNDAGRPNSDGVFGHQIAELNNKLYMSGGFEVVNGVGREGNDVYMSDNGVDWTQIRDHLDSDPNGFFPSDEHQMVSYRNRLWVFNGNRNTIHSSTDGITWSFVPFEGKVADTTHYTPRNGHQVVVYDDKLWLIGGVSGGIAQNDVWVSEDEGINWTQVKPNTNNMLNGFPASVNHQAVVFNGLIYVLVGKVFSNTILSNEIWSSADGANWFPDIDIAPFAAQGGYQAVVFENELWVISGSAENEVWRTVGGTGGIADLVWKLVTEGNETAFEPRWFHEAVVFKGELLVSFGKVPGLTKRHNDVWGVFDF